VGRAQAQRNHRARGQAFFVQLFLNGQTLKKGLVARNNSGQRGNREEWPDFTTVRVRKGPAIILVLFPKNIFWSPNNFEVLNLKK
jgi:hypothetical protein